MDSTTVSLVKDLADIAKAIATIIAMAVGAFWTYKLYVRPFAIPLGTYSGFSDLVRQFGGGSWLLPGASARGCAPPATGRISPVRAPHARMGSPRPPPLCQRIEYRNSPRISHITISQSVLTHGGKPGQIDPSPKKLEV